MPCAVRVFRQLVQSHEIGNGDTDRFLFVSDLEHFHGLAPLLDLLRGIGLFHKVGDFHGVEGQFILTAPQLVPDGFAAASKPLKAVCGAEVLPQQEIVQIADTLCLAQFPHEFHAALGRFGNVLKDGILVEGVYLTDKLFQALHQPGKHFQLLRGHFVDGELTGGGVSVCGPDEVIHPVKEIVGQLVTGVSLVHIKALLHGLAEPFRPCHNHRVRLRSRSALEGTLAGEVQRIQKVNDRVLDCVGHSVKAALIAGVGDPLGDVGHVIGNAFAVLLDTGALSGFRTEFVQRGLGGLFTLLLKDVPGFGKHVTQNGLAFHVKHGVSRFLDPAVEDLHPGQCLLRSFAVCWLAKLLLTVSLAHILPLLSKLLKRGQSLLEDTKSVLFAVGVVALIHHVSGHFQKVTVCHGRTASGILLIIVGSVCFTRNRIIGNNLVD